MKRSSQKLPWVCCVAMCVAAMVVGQLSKSGKLTSTQLTLHNLMTPGRLLGAAISSPHTANAAPILTQTDLTELQNQLLANELQRRQLLIKNAQLKQQLLQVKRLPRQSLDLEDALMKFDTVPAQIVAQQGTPEGLQVALIDAGRSSGLRASELVIDHSNPLLDIGIDTLVEPGQSVVTGSVVVGRIQKTAAWVSSLLLVTDEEFSAAVEIVRDSEVTSEFPTTGMLRGTGGRTCRIDSIPYTAAVSVGDDIFSADLNGLNGPRLYFGKVSKAQFSAGGEWSIEVIPAIHGQQLRQVSVIRARLNESRIKTAQQSESGPQLNPLN